MNSAIYQGIVRHKRYSPQPHEFSYKIFMPFIDLQDIDQFFQQSLLWSNRYPALAWFRRKDYFDKSNIPLEKVVKDFIKKQTGKNYHGNIRMLTHLRYFGYIINPITCYYCYDETAEHLEYIIAEVTNTPWHERCHYLIPTPSNGSGNYQFDKTFHVSPFMPMDMTYRWHSNSPDKQLNLKIENFKEQELIFTADLDLHRVPANNQNLNNVLFQYPFLTMQIGMAIYHQAYKLWRKGVTYIPRPTNHSVSEQ